MSDRESAEACLQAVQQRIQAAIRAAGRDQDSVRLIGAAKQQSGAHIGNYCHAGLVDIGHNYLQEALPMQNALADLGPKLAWHFIGAIQSNKTRDIAHYFDWVHSVDRLKIARRLSGHRVELSDRKLNVLLQVNVDDESSKSGVGPEGVLELTEQCLELPGIVLRGYMTLPKAREGLEKQREPFKRLRQLLEHSNAKLGIKMDTLSMGMSNDLEAAIIEGSTMVRVGTALFGARN